MAISGPFYSVALLIVLSLIIPWQHTCAFKEEVQEYVKEGQCGTSDDLTYRIEVCAKPLMDLIEGTVEKWPRNNNDIKDLCKSFGGCERCIRENARKCAKGLHRTIISTVASSIHKARKAECHESQFPGLLKTTTCFEKNQAIVHRIMSNITSHLYVIEKQITDLDAKTNAVCCMVNDIEHNIKRAMDSRCPAETQIIIRIIRAVLEDALTLICRSSKCKDVFAGHKVVIHNSNKFGGLISTILRIVFTLG